MGKRSFIALYAVLLGAIIVPSSAPAAPMADYRCVASGTINGHTVVNGFGLWYWDFSAEGTCIANVAHLFDVRISGHGYASPTMPAGTSSPNSPFDQYLGEVSLTDRRTGETYADGMMYRFSSTQSILAYTIHPTYFGGGGAGPLAGAPAGVGTGVRRPFFKRTATTSSAKATFVFTVGEELPADVPPSPL